jgi:hypothetical protein
VIDSVKIVEDKNKAQCAREGARAQNAVTAEAGRGDKRGASGENIGKRLTVIWACHQLGTAVKKK